MNLISNNEFVNYRKARDNFLHLLTNDRFTSYVNEIIKTIPDILQCRVVEYRVTTDAAIEIISNRCYLIKYFTQLPGGNWVFRHVQNRMNSIRTGIEYHLKNSSRYCLEDLYTSKTTSELLPEDAKNKVLSTLKYG